jgi:hypothetical protein
MMSEFTEFLNRVCTDTAVYWEYSGPDGYGGHEYKSAVEINCRWMYEREVIVNDQGKQIISNAQILVLQDLVEQSMIYKGTLDDLDSDETEIPEKSKVTWHIKRFRKVPSIDGRSFNRKAYL